MKIHPNSSSESPQELNPRKFLAVPPARREIEEILLKSEASMGSFLMGFITLECIEKLHKQEAIRLEIELTTIFADFAEAVEERTAVIICTGTDGKPRFEFSLDMHRLIEANQIEDFALKSDEKTWIFAKDEVETAKYTASDIHAFVLRFFKYKAKVAPTTSAAQVPKTSQNSTYPLKSRSERLQSTFKAKRNKQAQEVNERGKLLQKTEAFFKNQIDFNLKFKKNLEKLEKIEKASEEEAAAKKEKGEELSEKLKNRTFSVQIPIKVRYKR